MSVESEVPLKALIGSSRVTERAFAEREMLPPCGVVEMRRPGPRNPHGAACRTPSAMQGAELVTID